MRNQLVLCWSGSPSAFGYRMGWLRALLGQKLRSVSRSFAALFILFVRFGYPNLARGVLAEIRSHYARQQSNPSARMQKHRYHGDESKVAGKLQKVRDTICTSMIPKINGYPHLKIVNQFTGGQYVNLVPQEHTVLRHCDVLDRQSNVTLMKNVVEVHFCGCKAAN